jgi:hypothetical protein
MKASARRVTRAVGVRTQSALSSQSIGMRLLRLALLSLMLYLLIMVRGAG